MRSSLSRVYESLSWWMCSRTVGVSDYFWRVFQTVLDEQMLGKYRVAQKKWATTNLKKTALKIANEIRLLRKVKVWIKHYNTIRW